MSMKRVIRHSAGAALLAASIALAAAPPPAMASAPAGSAAASDPAPPVYVVGTVRAGVELGCKVLVTSFGAQYVLVGGDSTALPVGSRLLINGRVLGGVATTCIQGYPLQVLTATPL